MYRFHDTGRRRLAAPPGRFMSGRISFRAMDD
jgi:hypothetical protein